MHLNKYIMAGLCGLIMTACQTTPKPVDTPDNSDEPPKYEPLVYGTQKPLVCTTAFPAEDNTADRPNLQVMWENYLYDRPEGIWGEIGGFVEINGNLPLDQGR